MTNDKHNIENKFNIVCILQYTICLNQESVRYFVSQWWLVVTCFTLNSKDRHEEKGRVALQVYLVNTKQ